MDQRMQRAKLNAASTLLSQLVATAVGILIPGIMISHYGSEAYGATTSIAQFLAYISLFEGGIGRVARGALYGPLASGNQEEISRIYLAVKRFFSVLGIAFLGYTLVLALIYHDIADVSAFTRQYTFMLVIAIAVSKFAEYMWGISNITLFHADQRQYIVNAVIILSNILNVAAIVILTTFGAEILWVKLASSLVFVLKPIVFTVYLKKHYTIRKTEKTAVLKNKAIGIAQHMAYVIQNNVDVLILTICADLKMVAVYSVYHLISFNLRNITTSLTGGMEAIFGNMIAKDEREALRSAYRKYKFILTFFSLTFFGAAGTLIVPFIRLYTSGTTDANYIQPAFAIILLLADAATCLSLPCFNLSIAANKLRESQLGAYGEAAVNLVLSFTLVFWNPLAGVALATLISVMIKSVYYIVFAAKNILFVKPARLLAEFFAVVAVLLLIAVGGMMAAAYLPLYNYWRWIAAGVVTVVAVGGISAIVGAILYPKMIKSYLLVLKRKLKL